MVSAHNVGRARLTPEMLDKVLPEQEIISFYAVADMSGVTFPIKFQQLNGNSRVLFLAPSLAFHVRDCIRQSWRRTRRTDVRRRKGDKRPEVAQIRRFLDNQPDWLDKDWDAKANDISQQPIGVEVHDNSHRLYLGWNLGDEIYQVHFMSWAISAYFVEMVDEAENSGELVNLDTAIAPTSTRQ